MHPSGQSSKLTCNSWLYGYQRLLLTIHEVLDVSTMNIPMVLYQGRLMHIGQVVGPVSPGRTLLEAIRHLTFPSHSTVGNPKTAISVHR